MARIPAGSFVLLDSAVLIYVLNSAPHRGPLADAALVRIESGEIKGLVSSLVLTEILVPFYREGRQDMADTVIARLRTMRNLEMRSPTIEICVEAARMRASLNLRTADALHAATALVAKADGILTNDRRLKRLSREGLKIWQIDEIEA